MPTDTLFNELFESNKALQEIEKLKKAYIKALDEIKKAAIELKKELKGVGVGQGDELTKLNAKVDELIAREKKLKGELADVNKLLEDGVGKGKKKVKEEENLNKAIKKQKKFLRENVTVQEKQTKEVVESKKQLEKLNSRLKQFNKLGKQAKTTWQKVTGALSQSVAIGNILSNVAMGFGRALWRGLKNTIRIMADFEHEMAGVKAITQATGDEFQQLEKDAIRLGGATIFTATEVARLQQAYGKLGFSTGEILNATEATLDLAAATQEELASSAAIAGSTLRAFGLNAIEMQRVVDVMAKSFTSSALDLEKFRESMKFVAPIAKKAGFSIEGTTAILGKLADAGLHGSIAGTSLRNILLKLADANSDLSKAIGKPIQSIDEFIPAMRKLRDSGISLSQALEITDRRAVTAFATLIDAADDVEELTNALYESAGAAREMAGVRMETLTGKVTILKSAWEGLVLTINNSTNATGLFSIAVELATKAIRNIRRALETEEQAVADWQEFVAKSTLDHVIKTASKKIVLKRKESREAIEILKKQLENQIISTQEYNEKIRAINKDVTDTQNNEFQKRLEKTIAYHTKREEDAKRSLDRVTKEVEDHYAGISNLDDEQVKDLDKRIDDANNWVRKEEVILNKLFDAYSGTYEEIVSTFDDKDKAQTEAFAREQARVDGMIDGWEKEVDARELVFKRLEAKLIKHGESVESAVIQRDRDIAGIKHKWALIAEQNTIDAMGEGLAKQLKIEQLRFKKLEFELTNANIDTEVAHIEHLNNMLDIEADYILKQDKLLEAGIKSNEEIIMESLEERERIALADVETRRNLAIASRDFEKHTQEENKKFLKEFEDEKTLITLLALQDRLNLQLQFGAISLKEHTALMKQIEAKIEALGKNLKDNVKKNKFSFWQLIGLDEKDDQELIQALEKTATKVKQILNEMVDREVEMADRAVEASERRVDQLQRDLEREDKIRQEGFANNVSLMEAELARAKAQQRKAEQAQKEALERQQRIEKAMQVSSLMTATADIIEGAAASSGVAAPIVAGISIAAMWTLWAKTLSKANSFKEGVIDLQGPGTTTSDSIPAWLSKRESVMTADETIKYGGVLGAIRAGDEGLMLAEAYRAVDAEQVKQWSVKLDQGGFDRAVDRLVGKTVYENGYRIEYLSRNRKRISKA